MLKKLPTRQNKDEPRRQLFADDFFDLYVWYQPDDAVVGFQLCYDKMGDERALTWMSSGLFRHDRIDGGDNSPFHNRSPVMVAGCFFKTEPLRTEFIERSSSLDTELRKLILEKIDAIVKEQSANQPN